MPDHTDIINLVKTFFDDQNVKRRLWSCLGQTCFRSLIVFLSQFCNTRVYLRLFFAYTFDQGLWRIYSLGRNLVQCSRIHFNFTKLMNKLIATKNRIFISLVGPRDSDKTYLIHEWLKVGIFQPKFNKICFFFQHPQPLYDVMQKEIDNLELVQDVHFEFINSLNNNGTKYLLIFDDSRSEICKSKEFVDIATAGRHRGFSTIYIKQNLFHQSKLGRDAELQNKYIVIFKSPRELHQVATLSVQLGLGSALVDWYRDATSVPFGHLLIDLSPRTDDHLRYCTNSGKIPPKFYVPDNLKHLKCLDNEHTKDLHSPSIPTLFPRLQNSVSKNLSKKSYPISQRVHRQPAARKLVRNKKKSRLKVERRNSRNVFKKNNLEATKKSTFVAKKVFALKNNFPLRH